MAVLVYRFGDTLGEFLGDRSVFGGTVGSQPIAVRTTAVSLSY
jgi:hypothetical protein